MTDIGTFAKAQHASRHAPGGSDALGLPYSPLLFGAVGDGVADDTTAVQAAINAAQAAGRGTVQLGKHKLTSEIIVTGPNITLRGGQLLGRGIKVAPAVVSDIDFRIENVQIDLGTITTGRHGISLSRCGRGSITGVLIQNADHAIHLEQIATFQHVRRVKISDSVFHNSNYALWCLTEATLLASTDKFGSGDIQWVNNQSSSIRYTHILGSGVDGLVCTGSTMFSGAGGNPTSLRHIDLDYSIWVSIQGCNFFESGTESIRLSHFQNCNVIGNNIAWPGQLALSSGILCEGGDIGSTNIYCISNIAGNDITFPTKHGIEVSAPCGYLNITDNMIMDAGNATYWRGAADINAITHYAISTASGTDYIHCRSNSAPSDNYNFAGGGLFDGNMDLNKVDPEAGRVLTPNNSATSFSVSGGVKRVSLTGVTARTITSITGAANGHRLVIFSFSDIAGVIQNNAAMKLKGGVDAAIPNGATLSLFYSSGSWWETARSF